MDDASPGGHRILLVDDDPAVRDTLGKVLRKAGYHVDEAASGEVALEAVDRQCPDILLSDLVIPPPNGEQLAALSRQHCPDTILIFMSGYSEDELHELDIKQVVFLPKPLEADALLETVERLLERRAGG